MKTVSTNELPPSLRRLLGKYRKRSVYITENCDSVSVGMNGYRDGGSVSYFAHYVARGSLERSVATYSWPKFESRQIELLPHECIVESGRFCGKTATTHIYLPDKLEDWT